MKLIWTQIFKFVIWCVAIGVGVWYMADAIGGSPITYTSAQSFLRAVGACDANGVCDASAVRGCVLCPYIDKLFATIGAAAYSLWDALIANLWILLALGFVVYLFIHAFDALRKANAQNAKLDASERKINLKEWFDPVWRQFLRVLVVGVLLGAVGMAGPRMMQLVSRITVTPVMYVGSELSMAATGVGFAASCDYDYADLDDGAAVMGPALKSFKCVVGNLNTVVLAGASGGFAMMNFAWMGGGVFTWLAGLALVIMFLYIAFDLFFQVLNIVFRIVFLIVFLPVLVASWAFAETWNMMQGAVKSAMKILIECALKMISVSLQIVVIYMTVLYVADEYYPGPVDGYSAILPSGIVGNDINSDRMGDDAKSIAMVMITCENMATANGAADMDKTAFRNCFDMQRASARPGAFDFLDGGFSFLLMMFGLFLMYQYVIKSRIEALLKSSGTDPNNPARLGDGNDKWFDFGTKIKELAQSAYRLPTKIFSWATGKLAK